MENHWKTIKNPWKTIENHQKSTENARFPIIFLCFPRFSRLQLLGSAPACALQQSPVLAMVLESFHSDAALLPELAAVASFRAWDVPQLRETGASLEIIERS